VSWIKNALTSSIGKKFLVALTGLALVGFLFAHIYGNMNIFGGSEQLSIYAQHLHEWGWLLTVAEIGLLVMFVVHIGVVIKLTVENRSARGSTGYKKTGTKRGGFEYWTSKLMVVSGLIVLFFLIVHIIDFRLERAAHDEAWKTCLETLGSAAACEHTIGTEVIEKLQVPWRAGLYILGSLFIGWHLFHGIQSAFRSFGVNNEKWTPVIEKAGMTIGIVIGLLFASIPAYIYISGGDMPGAKSEEELQEVLEEHAIKSGIEPAIEEAVEQSE
jgi:succinate dehydrogenase / fumarate reductase cytochrome b subunit